MTQAYGFKDRSTAERLKDFAGKLGSQPQQGMKAPQPSRSIGQHRTYWLVPKGTIPPATDEKTPGVGKAYICKLNREADPPALERHSHGGEDVEVDVFNYTFTQIKENETDELKPLLRVSEDVFGDLSILHYGPKLAQAPVGGVPKRVGKTPGEAICTAVIVATSDGVTYDAGDLAKSTFTFKCINWDTTKDHAVDGDRIFQVSEHNDAAQIVGSSCTNTEDPADITVIEEPEAPEEPKEP